MFSVDITGAFIVSSSCKVPTVGTREETMELFDVAASETQDKTYASLPALEGREVLVGHIQYCALNGHSSTFVKIDSEYTGNLLDRRCSRCGEVLERVYMTRLILARNLIAGDVVIARQGYGDITENYDMPRVVYVAVTEHSTTTVVFTDQTTAEYGSEDWMTVR